jgi:muconolactone delta-isomerase
MPPAKPGSGLAARPACPDPLVDRHPPVVPAVFREPDAISVPEGTPRRAVENTEAREAQRVKELAGALGLWRARDAAEMQAILKSLPLDAWMTVETTPLTEHPSDPL